jgi:hypothetical protein
MMMAIQAYIRLQLESQHFHRSFQSQRQSGIAVAMHVAPRVACRTYSSIVLLSLPLHT